MRIPYPHPEQPPQDPLQLFALWPLSDAPEDPRLTAENILDRFLLRQFVHSISSLSERKKYSSILLQSLHL
jgi:hypothetical protein